jgi:hypothetical protein
MAPLEKYVSNQGVKRTEAHKPPERNTIAWAQFI